MQITWLINSYLFLFFFAIWFFLFDMTTLLQLGVSICSYVGIKSYCTLPYAVRRIGRKQVYILFAGVSRDYRMRAEAMSWYPGSLIHPIVFARFTIRARQSRETRPVRVACVTDVGEKGTPPFTPATQAT